MGVRGPIPKSADLRILEGERAHRPLPQAKPRYEGLPERPKGMTAAARRIWDGYVAQLAGSLRVVDGFALRRLCEDVAQLEELQKGLLLTAAAVKKKAKAEGKEITGGALFQIVKSQDGRRIMASISSISGRVQRQELQFGLTPVSSGRVGDGIGIPFASMTEQRNGIEEALCG